MKQISCRTRGATPSVPSIPARRIEPRMKRVVKPWENCDILGHHGRTLGSAGVSIYIYMCVCVWGVDGCVGKNPFRTLDSVDMRVLSRHHGLLTYTKSWSNPWRLDDSGYPMDWNLGAVWPFGLGVTRAPALLGVEATKTTRNSYIQKKCATSPARMRMSSEQPWDYSSSRDGLSENALETSRVDARNHDFLQIIH